ncbi:MAG: molybdopterin oxidoreductase family protein [Cyanobacteria bacterium P01_F01_bin.86]
MEPQTTLNAPNYQTIPGACPHDCPDTCAWQVTVEDGVATKLTGDPDHPFTRGGLCGKVSRYLERVYSPDRILYPLRRSGPKGSGNFQRVSWEEALQAIGDRFSSLRQTVGATAILPYSYLGTMGLVQGQSLDRRFFARLGASRLQRDICGSTAAAGLAVTQGTPVGMLPEDLQHSRLILLWGTNTVVTNLHLWHFIRQAKSQGATVVVIDPLKTRTARHADWHLRPIPGTDTALALGMMHVIVAEKLQDEDYVKHHTLGFALLYQRLGAYTPKRVAALTGLDPEDIIRLARLYAHTRPAAIRLLVGMEHHANGAMMFRTIACLPALVGAWRDLGGGLIRSTGGYFDAALNLAGVEMPELEDPSIRAINMVQLGQALTDSDLAPPIQALFVYNSNPAVTAPAQNLVLAGLQRENLFTVVHEQFLTDTARYADYVLPATTEVEHLDLIPSWGHTYLTLNLPAIPPLGEAISNTELFRRLAQQMGFTDPYLQDSDEAIIRTALASDHPYLQGITLEQLQQDGWARLNLPSDWRPFAAGAFPTPSGKCEFYAESLQTQGLDPLPQFTAAQESLSGDQALTARYPLALITAKSATNFLNSSYGNLPWHLRREREPWLEIHPLDAASRDIADQAWVEVFNDRGRVKLRARVSDRVRPSVVSMPSGWWASLSPVGVSANALTADGLSDWGNGGDFYDTLVEVVRAASIFEKAPAING